MDDHARPVVVEQRLSFARCLLVTAILLVLGTTLLPGEPEGQIDWNQVFCIVCTRGWLADALANLALFLPLGVALGLLPYAPRGSLLFAAGLSLSVELAQFAIPGRDPSLGDFIFNTLGAALGGGIVRLAPRWVCPTVAVASRLSLLAAVTTGTVVVLTDVLLTPFLADTTPAEITYFGGSAHVEPSDRPLRLGGNTARRGNFQGRLDEVRVYRRARTAAEIQADMSTPVATAAWSPDLMAAYSFDEGSGTKLTDTSGHGNTGQVIGATWTSQGKFGGALVFDGVRDVVVVPNSPSLELSSAMTLEAWIYPTGAQSGWRAVLQKEYDAFFLLASSKAGALRPGGGGTFGLLTEVVTAPRMVPTHAWTHVALTYDGAVLELYLNGRLAARRLRWYPGTVIEAALDGLPIPAGIAAESRQLRARLLAGAPLRVRAVAAAPVATQAPLATLHDVLRNEIFLLAAEGDDVVFRVRTRAAAAELDSPAIRAPGVLRGLSPGDVFTVTMSRRGRTYCVDVNDHSTCGLGYTLGMGWAVFVSSQIPPGWPHAVLNSVWMAGLFIPFGFWLRRRWESLLGALVLAGCVVLPCTIGHLSGPGAEIGAAIVGILVGSACALGVARAQDRRRASHPRRICGGRANG